MLSTLNFPQWLMYNRIVHSCQTPWHIIASEALSCSAVLCYHYECVSMADTRHDFLLRTDAVKPLWLPARSSWNEGTSVLFETTVQPLTAQNNPVWLTLLSESHRNTFTSSSYSFYFNICYTTRTDIKSSFLSLWIYLNWIRQVPGVQVSSFVLFFFYKMTFLLFTHSKWMGNYGK